MVYSHFAFGNLPGKWTKQGISILLDYAKENNLRMRTWICQESQIILFVLELPYIGEDTGSELCEKMKGMYHSLGLASDFEFEQFGEFINPQLEDYHIYSRIYGNFPPIPN